MGLGKRLDRGKYVFHTSLYLSVIGNDIKKLASAKFGNLDQKTVRKSLQALVKDLRQQEPTVHEMVASSSSPNLIEYHGALVTSAETHLTALDDGQTGRGDTWNPLYLAMRGWCERMKAVDLVANPKGGATTQALDLLWRHSSGEANADNPPVAESKPSLSDFYINLRLHEIEERPIFRRPRIPLGPYVVELGMMYEKGAVLGAARPDCVESLVKLCGGQLNDDNRQMLLGQAEFHMGKIRQNQSTATNKYIDLVMDLMYSNVPPESRREFIAKNLKNEKRREDAVDEMTLSLLWGMALGRTFPEETKGLWEQGHEGSVPFNFSQYQENILEMTAAFVAQNYPEQLDNLNLKAQLQRLQQGKSVTDEWLPK